MNVPSAFLLLPLATLTALAGCPSDDGSAEDSGDATSTGTQDPDPETSTGAQDPQPENPDSSSTGPGSSDASDTSDTSNGSEDSDGSSSDGEGSDSSGGTDGDGAAVVPLPGPTLFPEGVTADDDEVLYVGSSIASLVLRIAPPYTDVETFSEGQLTRGALGMFDAPTQGVLLVCDSSSANPTASSLVALDSTSGMRIAEHELVPATEGASVLCNDGVVAADGHAYFSDSLGARLMRVRADDLLVDGNDAEVFVESPLLAGLGPFVGANGVAELDEELYVVNFNDGALLHVPRDTDGEALDVVPVELQTAEGDTYALVGPDGMKASSAATLIVVENGVLAGGAGNRLLEITLDGTVGTVDEVASGFDIPTSAAEAGGRQWVVESQLDHLFGLDQSPPAPFQLVGIPWG